ncbi:hypothetical protein SAMN05421830_1241 [Desulfomicrobium norvegicum]|uniref:DUF6946 domain-containing protein n=1 Tax=Desulfomicrobium norvegicum (strain DSM 1741 / NCIMB 8310) TaxID=52561 RepID=A0A8G2C6A5_DESNO|nr:hypothetical protein [Desulfomicrobium norvegicum]SFM23299.1 hypothetical protein SAMN05421830_1241 [Desulfomicrobium norvegicum]
MGRILAFTSDPQDWKDLLPDPGKQWKRGYSARTLAHCWEASDGFPPEVAKPFAMNNEHLLAELTPILAVPEFKVCLPGGVRASQNDIFVLARSVAGPVVVMVEGKVNESFGPTVDSWRKEASVGKKARLEYLSRTLGLESSLPALVRYQLLHRAVSAIIVGEQYRASAAVLVIHSFSPKSAGWKDYQVFTRLFSVDAQIGAIQRLGSAMRIPLFGVWVAGNTGFLEK